MISIDTWAVVAIDGSTITVECPFREDCKWQVSIDEIGAEECSIGDILSTETGGWDYLKYEELDDLNDEGRKIFFDYIKRKGFKYSDIQKYGFIADTFT